MKDSKKQLKTLNFKIDERLLENINYYREVELNGSLSQVDYVTKALNEKNEKTKLLRSGGSVVNIQNPDLQGITKEQEEEIINVLTESVIKLLNINPHATLGLDEILIYIKRHSLMTENQKSEILANACDDNERE